MTPNWNGMRHKFMLILGNPSAYTQSKHKKMTNPKILSSVSRLCVVYSLSFLFFSVPLAFNLSCDYNVFQTVFSH